MKKLMSILLVLLLAAALLPTAAFADGPTVVLSNQGLRVNGVRFDCERYNIDGSNYFKLRDLAYVLNGTGSQFSVSWDGANKCVSLVTGELYEPNGSEMMLSDVDKIDTTAPSLDKIVIDGEVRTDLSAYKIGGSNYFKLKDLGAALGFQVDYDADSRTMIVVTKAAVYPAQWLVTDTIYNTDGAATAHSRTVYDEKGRKLSYLWEDEYGSESYSFTYDELDREISYTYDYSSTYEGVQYEDHSVTTSTYDKWGQLAKTVYEATGDVVSETNYTYDDNGNVVVQENLDNAGRSAFYSTYDENGNRVKYVCAYEDEVAYTYEYEYDDQGRVIRSREIEADGEVNSTVETTYVSEYEQVNVYQTGEYKSTVRYVFDANGNVTRYEWTDGTNSSVNTIIYNERNNPVQDEYAAGDYSRVIVYTYNEMGLLTKIETTSSDNDHTLEEYTYDEAGNVLTNVYSREGYICTTTHTYDPETRTDSILVMEEYVGVG